MNLIESIKALFPSDEKKKQQSQDAAKRNSLSYVYVSDIEEGNPCICIDGTPIFRIYDGASDINQCIININDVQSFIKSVRETYVEKHKNDDYRATV